MSKNKKYSDWMQSLNKPTVSAEPVSSPEPRAKVEEKPVTECCNAVELNRAARKYFKTKGVSESEAMEMMKNDPELCKEWFNK